MPTWTFTPHNDVVSNDVQDQHWHQFKILVQPDGPEEDHPQGYHHVILSSLHVDQRQCLYEGKYVDCVGYARRMRALLDPTWGTTTITITITGPKQDRDKAYELLDDAVGSFDTLMKEYDLDEPGAAGDAEVSYKVTDTD